MAVGASIFPFCLALHRYSFFLTTGSFIISSGVFLGAGWLLKRAQDYGPPTLLRVSRVATAFVELMAARVQRRQRYELTEDQKQELRESFDLFDAEKKGSIDMHELKVLMRALGFAVKKNDVLKLVHDFDPNNEGVIKYDLCMDVMAELYGSRDPDEEIMKAFQLFDGDGSGSINLKNMRSIARELGENLTDDELQAMIDEFDMDQDGEINKEEFLAIMKQNNTF
jgi:centrin-3